MIITMMSMGLLVQQPAMTAENRVERALERLEVQSVSLQQGEIDLNAYILEQSGSVANGGWLDSEGPISFRIDREQHLVEMSGRGVIHAANDMPYTGVSALVHGETVASETRNGWIEAPIFSGVSALMVRNMFPAELLEEALASDSLELSGENDVSYTTDQLDVTLTFGRSGDLTGFTYEGALEEHLYFAPWHGATISGQYGFWWTDETGRSFPRMLEVTFNGLPYLQAELSSIETIDSFEEPLEMPELGEAPAFDMNFNAFPFSQRQEDVQDNVRTYYGSWNITAVDTADGVVIFDAPISPGYSRQLIEAVRTDFADRPILGVFTTSNSWPHMGGIREYAAQDIAIFALGENKAELDAFIGDDHEPTITYLDNAQAIGSDDSGIRFMASPGPETVNMGYAILPDLGLLYASDALQISRDGLSAPHARQYLREFALAACSSGAGPDFQVLGHHIDPIRFGDLLDDHGGPQEYDCDF